MMDLTGAFYRLSGAEQAERAKRSILAGQVHHSDAITGYEVGQAFYLAVFGVAWFTPWGPTSAVFRSTVGALPDNGSAFWIACAALGIAQLGMVGATRLFALRSVDSLRIGVLMLSMFLHLVIAGAWFMVGSAPALAGQLLAAGSAVIAINTVSIRSGWGNSGDR